MTIISLSQAAFEKIRKDLDVHRALRGADLQPFLMYYRRSYTHIGGEIIKELGDGFVLQFIKSADIAGDELVESLAEDGFRLFVRTDSELPPGAYQLDHSDGDFKAVRIGG